MTPEDWMRRQLKRLEYREALPAMKLANPEEQAYLQPLMNKKRDNLLRKKHGREAVTAAQDAE